MFIRIPEIHKNAVIGKPMHKERLYPKKILA